MNYSPRFDYTHPIVADLGSVEAARAVIDALSLPPDVGLRLRQEARSRSSHHSTRIEGNRLAQGDVASAVMRPAQRRTPDETEVRNYWRALEWIEVACEDRRFVIDEEAMRTLHALILPPAQGRPPKHSTYRSQEIGVIDSSRGRYEYMAPAPGDVPALMRALADWISSAAAAELPAPVRAAIVAYQFLTIHPFADGNGRTARALATLELWRSGYGMRGFLSIEEHYTRDLARYYSMLQMGLPANYYKGRHDPDLTPWLGYFVETLASAANELRTRAIALHHRVLPPQPYPWESLHRLQQQLLLRCLGATTPPGGEVRFSPAELADWFGVHSRTATEWLKRWAGEGFVEPASGTERIREWRLSPEWRALVGRAATLLAG